MHSLILTLLLLQAGASAPATQPPPLTVTIPAETMVTIRVTKKLTPTTVEAGQALPFVVDQDVVVDGHVVIRASEPVEVIATDAQKKSTFAFRQGRLDFVIRATTAVDGKRIELQNFKDYSQTGETPSFGHAYYSNPKVKSGQKFVATVKSDTSVTLLSSLPAK
jgi:hypothetical protein